MGYHEYFYKNPEVLLDLEVRLLVEDLVRVRGDLENLRVQVSVLESRLERLVKKRD